jgi:hypothetical protein
MEGMRAAQSVSPFPGTGCFPPDRCACAIPKEQLRNLKNMKILNKIKAYWRFGLDGSGRMRWLGVLSALCLALVARADVTILSEGFEGTFPGGNGWSVGDANATGTPAYWEDEPSAGFGSVTAHTGNWKGYCAGIGFAGTAASPIYQNNMRAYMEKSLNFSGYFGATLLFWLNIPTIEANFDYFRVLVDGTQIWGVSNAVPIWIPVVLDLSAYVGGTHTLRFEFVADTSNAYEGAYLDDIVVTGVPLPPNDQCAGAVALTPGVLVISNTANATSTGDPTPTCRTGFGKGVWFKYTPTGTGPVLVSTCGSDFDTAVAVYVGSCGSLTQIACNDDNGLNCSGTAASLQFPGTNGTTYYILAGGYNSQSGNLWIVAQLLNDQCYQALPLTAGIPYTMSTADAVASADVTPSCRPSTGKTVWFTFTPSLGGLYVISTCGSDFDTVVSVYSGTCGSLAEQACNDDGGYACTGGQASTIFLGLPGTTYYIQAGGYNGASGNLKIVAEIPYDECSLPPAVLTAGTPVTINTTEASSTGDPVPGCGYAVGKGVWLTFTPSSSGVVILNSCGSTFDTVVQAYTGNCDSLTPVANGCGDDYPSCGSGGSYVTFMGTAGTLYRILAGGYEGDSGSLSLVASVATPRTLTVNATASSAPTIVVSPTDATGLANGATSFTRTYANGTDVTLTAPTTVGGLNFLRWMQDGALLTYSNVVTVTLGANHTMTAVYSPPNDVCGGAIALAAGSTSTMDTTYATSDFDPTPTCGYLVGNGVWFKYTPAANGVVVISTCASDYDTVVQAYTGSCAALTQVGHGCSDDGYGCSGSGSYVTFAGTSGTTYYILAGGYTGYKGTLRIVANVVAQRTLTVNSAPVSGVAISVYPQDITEATDGSTAFTRNYPDGTVVSLTAPTTDGFDVFKKWQLDGSDYATTRTISVTMGAAHTATAVFVPPNDQCSGAVTLVSGATVSMNTSTATGGDPLPLCQPYAGKGVWFKFTPAVTEQVEVSTCGSTFDTVLAIYSGTCGNLVPVAYGCKDDNGPVCSGAAASLVFSGTAGTTYYILAAGYNNQSGTLQIVATTGLINDQCAQAIPLTTGMPFTMTTVNATSTGDLAPTCQTSSGKGVWFTYTPKQTGTIPVSTCGSGFDTVLAVYTGTCGSLSQIACADDYGPSCPADRQASLTFSGTSNTTYYILATGYGASPASGTLQIVAGASPRITYTKTPTSLVLSWPADYRYWRLERQNPPGGSVSQINWYDVTTGVIQYTITPIPAQPYYYRLAEPY